MMSMNRTPYVKKVVTANPNQVRIIAHAKIKTDTIDASALATGWAMNSVEMTRPRYSAGYQ